MMSLDAAGQRHAEARGTCGSRASGSAVQISRRPNAIQRREANQPTMTINAASVRKSISVAVHQISRSWPHQA